MKVTVSGRVTTGTEEVTITVESDQEQYENKVADAYVRARDAVIKQKEKEDKD